MRRILGIILGLLVLSLIGAWLWLRGPDIPYETLEAKYAQADSHFVDLPGGYTRIIARTAIRMHP